MLGLFVDIETSGLDPYVHSPLEIGIVILDLLTGKELASFERYVKTSREDWEKSDKNALSINGIMFEMLLNGDSKDEIAFEIKRLFQEHKIHRNSAYFICQNPSFDRPFFSQIIPQYEQELYQWPYHWLDLASMYWSLKASKEQVITEFGLRLSKDLIAETLGLPKEKTPHKAIRGVRHLIQCYESLVGFPRK